MQTRGLAALVPLLLLAAGPAQADPHVRSGFAYGPEPSPGHVYEVLATLVQWHRSPYAEGDAARDWLLQHYADIGLEAEVVEGNQTTSTADRPVPCESVVARVPGRDPSRWVVIGGHYDVVLATSDAYSATTEGAYDNGVGTSIVVELARLFHQFHAGATDATLVFANWDCEEGGSLGATPFAQGLPEGVEVVANINLDMVGLNWPVVDSVPPAPQPHYNLYVYTAPLEDFRAYPGHVQAYAERFRPLRDVTERVAYQELGLPPKYVWVMDDIEGNSDQRAFVREGIPAMWLRGMHHGLLFNRGAGSPEDVRMGADEMNYKHTPADTLATLELYAGGKAGLLEGIRTPLTLAYRVALALAGGDAAPGLVRAAPGAEGAALAGIAFAALLLARSGAVRRR